MLKIYISVFKAISIEYPVCSNWSAHTCLSQLSFPSSVNIGINYANCDMVS